MISVLSVLKGCHGQREQKEQTVSLWPKMADTPGGKPQGNRVLQFNPRKNFLKSCPCSKFRRREIVNASSLKAGEQGLEVHFMVIQRVDGSGPLASSNHPVIRISGSMN